MGLLAELKRLWLSSNFIGSSYFGRDHPLQVLFGKCSVCYNSRYLTFAELPIHLFILAQFPICTLFPSLHFAMTTVERSDSYLEWRTVLLDGIRQKGSFSIRKNRTKEEETLRSRTSFPFNGKSLGNYSCRNRSWSSPRS